MSRDVIVIGSGFAGLSTASYLAKQGFKVLVLEKNDQPGGRARSFFVDGFSFDMGPSWYWMPDVFDNFFADFGHQVEDFYDLQRLDPSYRVYFGEEDLTDLPAKFEDLLKLFESIEKGAGDELRSFLSESAYKYEVAMNDLVQKPAYSLLEFADWRVIKGLFQLHLFKSVRSYVRAHFKNEKLQQIMEFPILFLGATPADTPALYTLMNYADMALGTWYPQGGMNKIVSAMVTVAEEQGVEMRCGEEVLEILTQNGKAQGVRTARGEYHADIIVGGADYHHVEQKLLAPELRRYTEEYWDKRKMAPSSLLFYLGVKGRVDNLQHHNLFFDEDFDEHAHEIYESPQWPSKPLFYVCCPSKTDSTVAPPGHENLFLLMPVAPGLEDSTTLREKYYDLLMSRLEKLCGENIRERVVYKRSYAHSDFIDDYHSFKGNAYGLANTLRQTAILKPSIRNPKVTNLFYTGQLTVPGPGVPPSLISGKIVANEIIKMYQPKASSDERII